MMYAQKEARSARQFKAVAIFATIVFHLLLFAAVGAGMFRGQQNMETQEASAHNDAVNPDAARNISKP